jgi:hypothetical protein
MRCNKADSGRSMVRPPCVEAGPWRSRRREPDGSLASGRVFFDMTGARGKDAIDGVKTLYLCSTDALYLRQRARTHGPPECE